MCQECLVLEEKLRVQRLICAQKTEVERRRKLHTQLGYLIN